MKLFLLPLLLVSLNIYAQVSYTSANYAAVADSYHVSNAASGLGGFDFSATGTAYIWNYSALPVTTQDNITYISPVSGGYRPEWCLINAYVLSCNTNFNALTNLATDGIDSVALGPVSVSNVVDHYRKTTSHLEYTMTGYTINLGGVPIVYPVQYTVPDSVYYFPLQYGHADSAHSSYTINLSSFGIPYVYTSDVYRRNYINGWGTLTTPYGTFPSVLKVKTILVSNDTVISGTTAIHTLDTSVQYKWFDTSYGIPVLEADGNIIAGDEVIASVTYIDSQRCLNPNALFITSPLVPYFDSAGGHAVVNFVNLSSNYDSSYWSFPSGSSSLDGPTDTFYCPGTYAVRLVVYNTCASGTLADTVVIPVTIFDTTTFAKSVITASGSTTFCAGGSLLLTGDTGTGYSYQWYNNGSAVTGAISNLYITDSTGSYTMVITNSTGCTDTSAAIAVTVNAYPVATITPAGPVTICSGTGVTLETSSGTGYTYKWYRGAVVLPAATDYVYTATAAGSYFVIIKNGNCKDTSADVAVSVAALPGTYTVTGGGSYCDGGTGVAIGLSGSATGVNYQLYFGGAATGSPVAGTGSAISFGPETAAGVYTVTATLSSTSCISGMADSATIIIDPIVAPSVAITASAGSVVCAGSLVTYLPETVNGGSAPAYTWYVNGIVSGTGNTYIYTPANGDTVSCMVISNALCASPVTAWSDSIVMVTELPATDTIIAYPGLSIAMGQTDTLVAVTTGTCSSLTYQWAINNVPVTGATSAVFVSNGFLDNDTVSCAVTCDNACGMPVIYDTVVMTVVELGVSVRQPAEEVSIAPNPDKGIFILHAPANGILYVYGPDGIARAQYKVGAGSTQILLPATLPAGIYMGIFRDNSGKKSFVSIVYEP